MLVRVVLLFSLTSLVSCATVPLPEIDHVAGAGYEGVIFSSEYARRTYYKSERRLWTPTRKMIAVFEQRFARALRAKQIPLDVVRSPRMRRQYLGMFEYQTGRRLMLVRLMGPAVYSDTRIGLTDFQSVPNDAWYGEAWFDPASKVILDFGGRLPGLILPGPHDRSAGPPPPPQPYPFMTEPITPGP